MADFVKVSDIPAQQSAFGCEPAEIPDNKVADDKLTMLVRLHLRFDEHYHDPLLAHYISSGLLLASRYSGCPAVRSTIEQSDTVGSGLRLVARHPDLDRRTIKAEALIVGTWRPVNVTFDGTFFHFQNPGCFWCGGPVVVRYCRGPHSIDEWCDAYPDLVHGILMFVAHAYEHAGDDAQSWAKNSGALAIWRSRMPRSVA